MSHDHALPRDIVLIAAISSNGAIGKNNDLLFRIPDDLQRFKTLTKGHPVIIGRKTFDSIGRPLPGRRNIVITRDAHWRADGVETAPGILEALSLASPAETVFVIGGQQIYEQAWPLATRLELTEVDRWCEGDTFFPMSRNGFKETSRTSAMLESESLKYDFVQYVRVHDEIAEVDRGR